MNTITKTVIKTHVYNVLLSLKYVEQNIMKSQTKVNNYKIKFDHSDVSLALLYRPVLRTALIK